MDALYMMEGKAVPLGIRPWTEVDVEHLLSWIDIKTEEGKRIKERIEEYINRGDKDFKWNTELLFLRVDLKKWYFFKSISTILMTSFIKIIQFLLFIILLQIPIKTIWLYCLKLLVTDIIYLYIIQQIAFTFYVLISIKRNYYIGLLLLFICMFFRIPINIVNLMNYLKIFIIITIILIVINYIIFLDK